MLLTIYLNIDSQNAFVGLFHEEIHVSYLVFGTCCSVLVDIPGPLLVVEQEASGYYCRQIVTPSRAVGSPKCLISGPFRPSTADWMVSSSSFTKTTWSTWTLWVLGSSTAFRFITRGSQVSGRFQGGSLTFFFPRPGHLNLKLLKNTAKSRRTKGWLRGIPKITAAVSG